MLSSLLQPCMRGSHQMKPVCAGVFHDKYERVNFWSHAVPGVLFLLLGTLALHGLVPGALPLFVYTCCTGATHLSSAATHVYPDSHLLVRWGCGGHRQGALRSYRCA